MRLRRTRLTAQRAVGAPFALSLTAGLSGFGFSSIEGTIVQPTAGLDLRKRLSNHWRASASATWVGSTSDRQDRSWLLASTGLLFQLTETVAMSAFLFDQLEMETFGPSRRWNKHTLGGGLGPSYRPLHWLSLACNFQVESEWNAQRVWQVLPPTEAGPLPVRWASRRFPVFWAALTAATHW